MRVLVTGATGFVGTVLCEQLAQNGHNVRAALRSARALAPAIGEHVIVGNIDSRTDWTAAMRGVDAVVHAAARVHVLHDSPDNTSLYGEVNAVGTRHLAECAVAAGVRRVVFLSSIKVNGEQTLERPFRADDAPAPQDAYGESKRRAETYLHEIAEARGLEVAIVRPPLIYGPGVRANFLRLFGWVQAGVPLPFGAVENRRSFVNLWNLADLLCMLVELHDQSPRTWLVSDREDVGTPELIRRIATSLERPARLLQVPVGMLEAAASMFGRRAEIRRLCGSLVVDSDPLVRELGWQPPVTMEEALGRTARWYLKRGKVAGE